MPKHFFPSLLAAGLFATSAFAQTDFRLMSPAFEDGGALPDSAIHNGFGCHGLDRSPELRWNSPPPETKSLAVTVYDPDAPTGSGWWHWVVYNLPAGTHRLTEGATGSALPQGATESRTDYGKPGFGGACPPVGDKPHRYVFTVYALDIAHISLEPDSSAAMIGFMLNQHALAKTTTTALYGR